MKWSVNSLNIYFPGMMTEIAQFGFLTIFSPHYLDRVSENGGEGGGGASDVLRGQLRSFWKGVVGSSGQVRGGQVHGGAGLPDYRQ